MKDAEPEAFRRARDGSLDPDSTNLDVSVVGTDGQSLLHEAIAFRHPQLAMALVKRGVSLDLQDRNGQTALHYAAVYGAKEVARFILAHGADPNLVDRHGNGPLWTSAVEAKGDYSLVRALIAAGASATHKNTVGLSVLDMAKRRRDNSLWLACGGDPIEFEAI